MSILTPRTHNCEPLMGEDLADLNWPASQHFPGAWAEVCVSGCKRGCSYALCYTLLDV